MVDAEFLRIAGWGGDSAAGCTGDPASIATGAAGYLRSLRAGNGDAFVAKLDANGEYLWARRFGDGQVQDATAVGFSDPQHLVIAGTFQSQIDFGNGPLTASGGAELYIASLIVP